MTAPAVSTAGSTPPAAAPRPTPAAVFATELLPHAGVLKAAAVRYTRNPDTADDLVQETLLKAWRCLHQYTPGSNARAWLLRILHTTYVSMWRVDQRQPPRHASDTIADYQAHRAGQVVESAEDTALAALTDPALIAAIRALPAPYRTALVLRDIRGLPYADIAASEDVPLGTVMSRLHRARGQIRAALTAAATS